MITDRLDFKYSTDMHGYSRFYYSNKFWFSRYFVKAGITLSIQLKPISCTAQLIEAFRLLHVSTNWWYSLDIFCFPSTFFFTLRMRFNHFYFRKVWRCLNFSIDWNPFSICWKSQIFLLHCTTCWFHPAKIYLFKFNNRNTRKRCEICSKLTMKIPDWRHWRRSDVFIVNFEQISH